MMKTVKYVLAAALLALAAGCGEETKDDSNTNNTVTTGKIAGTVTKLADGSALAGATVATEPATVTATSDAQGKYTLADLNAGTYKVIVTFDGYTTKERANVAVTAGGAVTLDFALEPATGGAKLTVKDLCGTGNLAGAKVARTGAADVTTGTDGSVSLADLAPGSYELTVSADAYLPAKTTATIVAGQSIDLTVELKCHSLIVAEAARAYLTTPAPTATITAKALHDKLTDADTTNDPKVLSVRATADYEKGHVPGAINVPWKNVANDDALAKIGTIDPTGPGLVDYCYTGHTGGIAQAILNMMGIKAVNMKYGIAAWTKDAEALGTVAVPPDQTKDFPIETTPHSVAETYEQPKLDFPAATTPAEVVKLAARAYLATAVPTISAGDLNTLLTDGNTDNDPVIISVRKAEDYAKGHITGAINIPWTEMAKPENLKKIPPNRDIVVYCYTGHTGAIATGVLGTLGYKVKNLKYGILGWTQDATARALPAFDPATEINDFPVTKGANP